MARQIGAIDIFLAVAIAASAVISDVAWAAMMESFVMPRFYPPGTPRLSYGFGWGFLLVLVVVPLGGIGGTSVLLARQGALGAAASLCLAGAALPILLLLAMWHDDVAINGYEPTKLIVYPVPVLYAVANLVWGCVMVVAALRRFAEKKG